MKILVVNAGSSSLKYQMIDMSNESVLCKGGIERIGLEDSHFDYKVKGNVLIDYTKPIADHVSAFRAVIDALLDKEVGVIRSLDEIAAVGHRILHSGEDFSSSVLFNDEVMQICEKNSVLGPLHMPANLNCVKAAQSLMPNTPMVGVFDTVFHSTMPDYAYMYAIPYEYYEKFKIRKYGFHGTSHKYVAAEALKLLGKTEGTRIITLHLGNGSSVSAVKDGKCIDTSMGLTPLEGLVMGTRSGDIDPSVVDFIIKNTGMTADEVVNKVLNKQSGFLGLAGKSDFRELSALCQKGDRKAKLAVDMFAYRVRKYIGSYYVALGGVDMIVFTGGIGENAAFARENIMRGLSCLGIDFDFEKNLSAASGKGVELSKPESKVRVVVIPTNEELVIAREAKELTSNR